jgi:hypothetical protein
MDDLIEIARLADEPPPSAADLRPARERLLAAIAIERAIPDRLGGPTAPEWTSTPYASAEADLTTATVHAAGPRAPARDGTGPGRQRTGPGRHPRRILAVAGLTTAVAAGIAAALVLVPTAPIGNHPPGGTADAAQVLRLAAAAAASQPDLHPRPDQFVYLGVADGPGRRQQWLSVDGSRDGRIVGSGGTDVLPGCRDGHQPVMKGDKILPGVLEPCEPLPAYHRDLPTTPAALLAWLNAHAGGVPGDVNALGKSVLTMLEGSYVQPRSLAALYGALGRIPGMQAVPEAVDAAGRHGVGVGWRRDGSQLTLIFDPTSHVYLGSAYTAPGGSAPTAATALLRVAVVDRVGQIPR